MKFSSIFQPKRSLILLSNFKVCIQEVDWPSSPRCKGKFYIPNNEFEIFTFLWLGKSINPLTKGSSIPFDYNSCEIFLFDFMFKNIVHITFKCKKAFHMPAKMKKKNN